MKISFVWDWDNDLEQFATWNDGLSAALYELRKRGHDMSFHTYLKNNDRGVLTSAEGLPFQAHGTIGDCVAAVDKHQPDVILQWGDMTRPTARSLSKLKKPTALCFAGGEPFGQNYGLFDHIFVESRAYLDRFQSRGASVSMAFGTNTRLFLPNPESKVSYDVFFPATYAAWKRHDLFAEAMSGYRAITSGFKYVSHETFCWEVPLRAGLLVLSHTSAKATRDLYDHAGCVVVTSRADGGSQRTVLEALAMNKPTIVMNDSDKTTEYIRGLGREDWIVEPSVHAIRKAVDSALSSGPVDTRSYVLANWSEHNYAENLEAGLSKIL